MATERLRSFEDFEHVLSCDDPESGLRAIIAVHDTSRGPALGGCRMWAYDSERAALDDALRLARGMTFKAALADLPLGGGKAVLIGDSHRDKSDAMLRAFGRMVESLGGRYITGEDVGMSVNDMSIIAQETRYVSGRAGASGDPSPVTAAGVFHGIRAALRHRTGSDDLHDARVAVQGVGHVGYHLCRLLRGAGARLVVSDVAAAALERVVIEFGANVVTPDGIFDADCDIFAPCALGGAINADTVPRLRAAIVAGAANNQLATPEDGVALRHRGILYAPDYVINAGGLINVAWEVLHRGEPYDRVATLAEVARIGPRLDRIFDRAAAEGRPPHQVADAMARERLHVSEAA